MSFVLACAQQHDGRDARRESGHGGRSLDWGRPIAPVAHRTERSAPDRKAAGSIPARRTKFRVQTGHFYELTTATDGRMLTECSRSAPVSELSAGNFVPSISAARRPTAAARAFEVTCE